jgi:hypothetical protein
MGKRAKRGSARRGRGVDFSGVRRLALALPGVEEGTSYGTPAFRVKGKFFVRLREDGESIVVKVGDDERDLLMEADPDAFFTTDHYKGYPSVLVRLSRVREADLAEVLDQAWARLAPPKLVAQREGRRQMPF